jgi:hypothetical protein
VIYGKVGRLGHGKTMRAVVDAIALCKLRGGLEVPARCWLASNIRVNVPAGMTFVHMPFGDGFSPALSALMRTTRDAAIGLVVLVDEVDEIWGATDWQSVLKGDRHRIKQSRHYGTDLIITCQYVEQMEKNLRNIAEEVEFVYAWPAPTIAGRERCKRRGKPHDHSGCAKRPLLIRGQRYRPAAVRELTSTVDKDKRISGFFDGWHVYRREHELLYDTDEIVEPVNAEALCARHRKEESEARCPMCHPNQSDDGARYGFEHLVAEAALSLPAAAQAR